MSNQFPTEKGERSLASSERPQTPPPAYTSESTYPQSPGSPSTPHSAPRAPSPLPDLSSGPLTLTFSPPIIHPPPPSAAVYLVPTSLTSKGIPLRFQRLIPTPNSAKQQERDLYESIHVQAVGYYTIRGLRSRCLIQEGQLRFTDSASSQSAFEIRTGALVGKKLQGERKVIKFDGTKFWYYPIAGSGKDGEKMEVGQVKNYGGDDKAGEIEIAEGVEDRVRDLTVLGWVVGIWKGGELERRKMDDGLLRKVWKSNWGIGYWHGLDATKHI